MQVKKHVTQDITSKDIWSQKKMGFVLGGGRCVKAYFAVKYVLSIYMLNSSKNDYGFYF